MKELDIIGYFTKLNYHFDLSDQLLDLIGGAIENEILKKYTFPKIKSTILEILLDAETEANQRKVVQLSKTGRGEYFSFRFFLPYQIVMQNGKVNTPAFVKEFMEALRIALSQFNLIPDELINKLRGELITEVESNPQEYEYIKSSDEIAVEKAVQKL